MKKSTFQKKLDNIRKKATAKVIDVTSDVLSAPAQLKAKSAIKRSSKDTHILKMARKSKGAPQFDAKGKPTEGFKWQTLAVEVKDRLKKK